MRKPHRTLPGKDDDERMLRRTIAHSRALFLAALAFLVVVGIGEIFYLKWELKSHGHLHAAFATVMLPFAAVLFVVVSFWNWRWISRHPVVHEKEPEDRLRRG